MKTMKTVVVVAFALALTVVQISSAKTVEIVSGGDIAVAITEATSDDTPAEVVLGEGDYAPKATISISSPVTVRGMTGNPADVRVSGSKARRVFDLTATATDAVISDLTIENGVVGGNGMGYGISITSGTISNCVVRNCKNKEYGGGGAIYLEKATAYAYNCVITNNYADGGNGGGGSANGCGLRVEAGTAVNCFIANNTVNPAKAVLGTGAYVNTGKLVNSTIVNNQGNSCGGVYTGNASAKVVNCLIWGNTADGAGGSVQTDIWAGKSAAFSACIARAEINANCLAADDWPVADDWWTPLAASIAKDASIEVPGVTLPETDVLGNARQVGEGIDIGAVENQGVEKLVAMTMSDRTLLGTGEIEFTAWVEGLEGVTGYTWTFGDGTTDSASGATARHLYSEAGAFPVGLTVHTSSGDVSCRMANTVTILPKTIYVKKGNAGAQYPYADETTAAADVATALAAASAGQEVVICPETYDISANLNFVAAITMRGKTGKPEDVVLKMKTACQMVRLAANGACVCDLTFDGNNKSKDADGILLRIESYGTVSNCVLRNANGGAYGSHGAIYLTGADALLTHCVVSNNATSGSGYKNTYAGVKLESSAKVSNCLIVDNRFSTTQADCVAGVYVNGGTLENCTVVGNTGKKCGGVRCDKGSVVNCAIAGNTAEDNGVNYGNIFKGNDVRFSNCASDACNDNEDETKRGIQGTDCYYAADKKTLFAGYDAGNFEPAPGSVLIDHGKTVDNPPAKDLAGHDRVMGVTDPAIIDIGAYEADASKLGVKLNMSANEAFVPVTITLTAEPSGVAPSDVCTYRWEFGDGLSAETSVPTVTHPYATSGDYTAKVTLARGSESISDTASLHVVPKTLVVKGDSTTAAFPYDTVDNAASNIVQALKVAISKNVIEVEPGRVVETGSVRVDKDVTVRGRTGNPSDVIVVGGAPGGTLDDIWNFDLANAGARFEALTFRSPSSHRHVRIDVAGGTVSNCVITGKSHEAAVMNKSASGLVTHCIISNSEHTVTSGGGENYKGIYVCTTHKGRLSNTLITGCTAAQSNTQAQRASAVIHTFGKVDNCTVVGNNLLGADDPVLRFITNIDNAKTNFLTTADDVVRDSVFAANTVQKAPALRLYLFGGSAFRCVGDFETDGIAKVATTEELFRRTAKGDWRLRANSPARDIVPKSELPADLPATDLGGNPRVFGVGLDAGCYECQSGGLLLFVR